MQLNQIMQQLDKRSAMPLENREAIANHIASGQTMTFFNWECPPRFLDRTRTGEEFVNYDMDLAKIFRGEIADAYTELPRVVEYYDQEIAVLQWLGNLGLKFRFVKLVADTNASYLTPRSLEILGANTVQAKFEEFAERIAERLASYPGETSVCLFTDLIRPQQKLYNTSYNQALEQLQTNPTELIAGDTLTEQLERTKHHMGMTDAQAMEQFSFKTIASYGAEGMVLAELSKTDSFSNCIWLNNHEVDKRTIAITNCLRSRLGKGPLPMLFVKA